jgi:hypothetical protein
MAEFKSGNIHLLKKHPMQSSGLVLCNMHTRKFLGWMNSLMEGKINKKVLYLRE